MAGLPTCLNRFPTPLRMTSQIQLIKHLLLLSDLTDVPVRATWHCTVHVLMDTDA